MLELDSVQLGYAANLGVGAFMGAASLVVGRRLRIPGHRLLAAFLALVAANYALDAFGIMAGARSETANLILRSVAYLLVAIDPPILSAFALTLASWRISPLARVLLFAPTALFLGYAGLTFLRTGASIGLGWILVPIVAGHYVLALVAAAHAHHRARTSRERELRGAMLVLLALIVLPRLPLLLVDLGYFGGSRRADLLSVLGLEGTLLPLALVAAFLFLRTAPPDARASARHVVTYAGSLIGIVAGVWLLRLAPGFTTGAYALLYSSRWIVLAGVIGADAQRQRVLGVPATLARPARAAFLALLGFLFAVEVTTLLATIPGATPARALVGGLAFTGLGIAGAAALLRARAADEEARLLKRRVYRAHLELDAQPASLAELRRSLGLSPEDAAEEERLSRAARLAPAGGLDRPEVGETFAKRYHVESLAGSGSFGLVYKAKDTTTGARVVLKELRPDWRASLEAAQRLEREASLALRVEHPHLVRLLAIERAPHGPVLVFAHADGATLRTRLARRPLAPAEAARLAREIAGALDALHRAGALHRDVKPDNIVLGPDGAATLLDLGSSGDVRSLETLLAAGAHPGTPDYMSPEQREGRPLGPESDFYALALVLREALGPKPPEAWQSFLDRALQPAPAERWPDAASFVAHVPE